MELSQLRAFLAVLDSGSLLHASKSLQVSRTTVHARVSALEDSLGVELLVRTHRGVQPTEFGRRFADGARALLADADALASSTARHGDEVLGELRVRVPVGLPIQLEMLMFGEVSRRYPELSFRIEVAAEPLRDVPDDVDTVVHFGAPPTAGAFRIFALTRVSVRALASRRYLDTHGRPAAVEDLAEHRLMSWCYPGFDGRAWPLREPAGDEGSVEVEPILVSNNIPMLRGLADMGQGIALLPEHEIARGINPGEELEPVLEHVIGREAAVYVLLPEAQAATPRSRASVRLMRELAAGVFGVNIDEPT